MSEFTKTLIVDSDSQNLVNDSIFNTTCNEVWSCGSNWTISGGIANRSTPSAGSTLEQSITLTEGEKYTIKYEVTASSANSGILRLEGSFDNEDLYSSVGTHEYIFVCTNSNNTLSFYLSANETISLDNVFLYKNFLTIKSAADYLIDKRNGGVIIVEQGIYTIASANDTVSVPSNVTIIGRGNVIINIEGENANVPAFKNSSYEDGNERITLSGFKIIVKYSAGKYQKRGYRF